MEYEILKKIKCSKCNQDKHVYDFYPKVKNICKECSRDRAKKMKIKRSGKDVMYFSGSNEFKFSRKTEPNHEDRY